MTREEFIKRIRDLTFDFGLEMLEYQTNGDLPEELSEGDWLDQFLAFIET